MNHNSGMANQIDDIRLIINELDQNLESVKRIKTQLTTLERQNSKLCMDIERLTLMKDQQTHINQGLRSAIALIVGTAMDKAAEEDD